MTDAKPLIYKIENSIARITLNPQIVFSGAKIPDNDAVAHLHHQAHEECFIAHSVLSEITVAGAWRHEVAAAATILD